LPRRQGGDFIEIRSDDIIFFSHSRHLLRMRIVLIP
jgi:hypothetical protein